MSECCEFEIKDSEEWGRFVIAKKEYRLGDVILDEKPLLIYPALNHPISQSDDNEEDSNTSILDCVGCFKFLTVETVHLCSKCQWPLCNSCSQLKESLHAKYECSFIAEKKIGASKEAYDHLYILRAVLMCRNDDNREHFDSLMSSYSLNQEPYQVKCLERSRQAANFFREKFEFYVDESFIGQIIGTCNVNGFAMIGKDQDANSYKASAIYRTGSMFAHSCAHNAEWVILSADYKGAKRWNLRVYARRTILCDEAINISYIPDRFTLDAPARRDLISKHYHFHCKCSRCVDPSDLSFYTEAIICPSCGDERLTTDNTSDEFSKWTCSYCGACTDYRFAKTCVENFDPSFICNILSHTDQDVPLTSWNQNSGLNPNHREIIDTAFCCLEYSCTQQFHELFQHSEGCDVLFNKLMTTATKCVKVYQMFGNIYNIVDLEWWFARMIAAYYFQTPDFVSIAFDPYLPEEKLKILTAICAHLKTAHVIMEWFPFDYMQSGFRQSLIDGCKFWNDQFKSLKDVCSVDMINSSEESTGVEIKVIDTELPSSLNDFQEHPTKKSDEISSDTKTAPSELSDPVTIEAHEESELSAVAVEMAKLRVSQSSDLLSPEVNITSPRDSNSSHLKPSVSLLTECDFYFSA